MATVTLKPTKVPDLMLEGYSITPDAFAGKTHAQIAALPAHEGKIHVTLWDFFAVSGESGATAADIDIVIAGDCTRVKYIGSKMTAGSVTVNGNADMYVSGWMKGGKIHITGNVDSFCGIQMEGGELLVDGDAKNNVGCAYRGDWRGMKGGTIRIKGSAGNDIGTFMLGGTIIIEKNAFIHVSTHAEGGTFIVKGDVEGRVGGQMVKGLETGLYRYLPASNSIVAERIDSGLILEMSTASMNFKLMTRAAVTFLWVALPYRSVWALGNRGYRSVLIEAGHSCQNLIMASADLGYPVFPTDRFHDDLIAKLAGLDTATQWPVYLAAVGKVEETVTPA